MVPTAAVSTWIVTAFCAFAAFRVFCLTCGGVRISARAWRVGAGEPPGVSRGKSNSGRVVRMAFRILGPVMASCTGEGAHPRSRRRRRRVPPCVEEIPRETAARVSANASRAERIRRCAVEMNALFFRVRRHLSSVMAGVISFGLLRRLAAGRWAEEVRADVDALLRGLPGNVTTEMDLAVGDLTDFLRPHPELATFIQSRPWATSRRAAPKGGWARARPRPRKVSVALRQTDVRRDRYFQAALAR